MAAPQAVKEKQPVRRRPPMAGRQSPPTTVDDLTGKFSAISVRSGGKPETRMASQSPASGASSGSSSPDSDLVIRRGQHTRFNPPTPQSDHGNSSGQLPEGEEVDGERAEGTPELSKEQREMMRFKAVRRKKDFVLFQQVKGVNVNVLQGLELHTNVFNAEEQKKIVDCIYDIQEKGRKGMLRERTYSEPRKWMRGKGRVTIQFGCCYNYATDKNGNPPGIIRDEEVDPIPPLLKLMIKRMVEWHVLPPSCIPNSCIINLYDKNDCIPPHIDHHDFVRPFCTVSFLSECNILFGKELDIEGPGEFSGPFAMPLPVGSVLIMNGNGADIAKHCVPAVPNKRISITFRKMDETKLPYRFKPDPELQNIRPLKYPASGSPIPQVHRHVSPVQQQQQPLHTPPQQQLPLHTPLPLVQEGRPHQTQNLRSQKDQSPFQLGLDDFPPLGSGGGRTNKNNRSIRQ